MKTWHHVFQATMWFWTDEEPLVNRPIHFLYCCFFQGNQIFWVMFSIVEQNEDGRIIYVVDYRVEFGIGIPRVILRRWDDHTWWAFCVISDQNSSVVNVGITLRIRSRIFTLTRVQGITSKVNTFAIYSSFNSNERTEWEFVAKNLLITVTYFN